MTGERRLITNAFKNLGSNITKSERNQQVLLTKFAEDKQAFQKMNSDFSNLVQKCSQK